MKLDFNICLWQIIVKQKGIFTNVTSPTAKAKNAGGFSSDGYKSVLNKAIINVISLNLGHKGWGKSNQILGNNFHIPCSFLGFFWLTIASNSSDSNYAQRVNYCSYILIS